MLQSVGSQEPFPAYSVIIHDAIVKDEAKRVTDSKGPLGADVGWSEVGVCARSGSEVPRPTIGHRTKGLLRTVPRVVQWGDSPVT